jgi:hypothetical protein
MSPSITQRCGLRYVNQLSGLHIDGMPPDLGRYFSRVIIPEIDRSVGDIIGSQQQLLLRLADETMCGLRVARANSVSFRDPYHQAPQD